MAKVTVLMSVYNGELYLKQSIGSILSQTFEDFEFLIIDDGSIDESCNIIDTYQDSRIRLIKNGSNIGLPASLNKGLKLAKGEFIARQDADDYSEPERLAKQVKFMTENPKVTLLGTWYKKIDAAGKEVALKCLPCDYNFLRWSLLFYCPFVHTSVMLRKAAILENISFYDTSFTYAEDYHLWSRIAQSYVIANLNEYCVRYRLNPVSMTSSYKKTDIENQTKKIRVESTKSLLKAIPENSSKDFLISDASVNLYTSSFDHLTDQEVLLSINQILSTYNIFCQATKLNLLARKRLKTQICHHLSNQIISFLRFQHQNSDRSMLSQIKLLIWSAYLFPPNCLKPGYTKAILLWVLRHFRNLKLANQDNL